MARLARSLLLALAAQATAQAPDARPSLPGALRRAQSARVGPVETEMRNVNYHAGPRAILGIRYLRGMLLPTAAAAPPWLEDPLSFVIAVDTARVMLAATSLAALMNDWVMHYPGAPLSGLTAAVRGPNLELKGRLHGLSFRIEAVPSVAADGRLVLEPAGVRLLGIGVRGLMRSLGIDLEDVMKSTGRRGLTVAGDSILLATGEAIPPPRLAGRLVAVHLVGDSVELAFGRSRRGGAPPLGHHEPPGTNYIYFGGGVLRFGKLTMTATDLTIVDADPSNPFDLSLAEFNRQLDAGHTRNLPSFGLRTTLPDFADLRPAQGPR